MTNVHRYETLIGTRIKQDRNIAIIKKERTGNCVWILPSLCRSNDESTCSPASAAIVPVTIPVLPIVALFQLGTVTLESSRVPDVISPLPPLSPLSSRSRSRG